MILKTKAACRYHKSKLYFEYFRRQLQKNELLKIPVCILTAVRIFVTRVSSYLNLRAYSRRHRNPWVGIGANGTTARLKSMLVEFSRSQFHLVPENFTDIVSKRALVKEHSKVNSNNSRLYLNPRRGLALWSLTQCRMTKKQPIAR